MRLLTLTLLAAMTLAAAEDRIVDRVDPSRTVLLRGQRHSNAVPANDRGLADPAAELRYATVMLKPDASLERYLMDLQNPASANYRRFLTPEQFADRFGLSANDVAQVVSWLRSEGLRVEDVARGRHWITFSGTRANVGRALHTEFHRYAVNGETHIANASEPSIPEALARAVEGFDGLDDFGDQPLSIPADAPQNTSGTRHFLAPDDFATIYNVKPLYDQGIDGTGIKIAVIGRTNINVADVQAFRKRFNLPPMDLQQVLVGPDPGTSSGDLGEANLDLDWSGAVARGATIVYVNSNNVRTSARYAVDQNLAPIMTYSYGACEQSTDMGLHAVGMQANAQGITWMVSSGDAGATMCETTVQILQAAKGPTVSYPANLPEVTAVGGTRINEGTPAGKYWTAANDANGASALSYIPELAWNDTMERGGFSSTGGGPSALFAKPWWQVGPGVPDDKARDIPDVSLSASPLNGAYLVNSNGGTSAFGGTSAGSPSFAGIVALLNQYLLKKGAIQQPGLGNINPTLYRLAQASPDIFHDITDGDNKSPCPQSSPGCVDGMVGYAAGPGFDPATGLGTVDAFNLVTKWTVGTASTTSLTASPATVDLTGTVKLTATVKGGKAAPTGTVTFLANDTAIGSTALAADGTASITVAANLAAGTPGPVTAFYGGDGVYEGSSAAATVKLNVPASGSLVVPFISPNPVPQSGINALGLGAWSYTVTLTEMAGVATKLTGFTVNGADNTPNIAAFNNGNIAAKASLSATFSGIDVAVPLDRTFVFSGQDADGTKWTQQTTVAFVKGLGPVLTPTMVLTVTPATVQQNPQADPACQFSQTLVLEERAGYLMQLAGFTAGSTSLTAQIPQLFGTTRLAPHGSLQAKVCFDGTTAVPSTKTYSIAAVAENGVGLTSTVNATFQAAPAASAALSVSPAEITLTVPDAKHDSSATVNVTFSGGSGTWRASVVPGNLSASWLKVTPLSGNGSGTFTVQASSAGLSNGAYQATVALEAAGAVPQAIMVPVTFVVGASSTKIAGATNAASFQPVYAPGMLMSVFGKGLSTTAGQARTIPLPFTMSGLSATVNGISAPVVGIFPASDQINLQVPYEAGAGPALLAINNNGQVSWYSFQISPAAPGLFGLWDPLGRPVTSAAPGTVVVAYITGEGDVTPTLPTGTTPSFTTAVTRLPKARLPLTVTVGGVPAATPLFNGIPSGVVGATQINFTIPAVAAGPQPVIVTVGGVASQPVTLNVTAQ